MGLLHQSIHIRMRPPKAVTIYRKHTIVNMSQSPQALSQYHTPMMFVTTYMNPIVSTIHTPHTATAASRTTLTILTNPMTPPLTVTRYAISQTLMAMVRLPGTNIHVLQRMPRRLHALHGFGHPQMVDRVFGQR